MYLNTSHMEISVPYNKIPKINGKFYLDNAATRPPSVESINNYLNALSRYPYNPHSAYNDYEEIIEDVKLSILDLLQLQRTVYDIIFTSGASESITTAITSTYLKRQFISEDIFYNPYEHSSTLQTLKHLESLGANLIKIPTNHVGLIEENFIDKLKNKEINCVVAIDVHNETGLRNNISELHERCEAYNTVLISDTTQTIGKDKIPNNLQHYFISGHKLGTTSSIGALIFKKDNPPYSIIHGSQQNNLRGGTLSLASILNLEFSLKSMIDNKNQLNLDEIINLVIKPKYPNYRIIKSQGNKSNHIAAIELFEDKTSIIKNLDNIIFSFGSACVSKLETKSKIYNHISQNEIIRISI